MSITNLKPDGQPFAAVNTISSGGSPLYSMLRDGNDTTGALTGYDGNPSSFTLTFENLTLPAGALIRRVNVKIRGRTYSGGGVLRVWLTNGAGTVLYQQVDYNVGWVTTTTAVALVYTAAGLTKAQVDDMAVLLWDSNVGQFQIAEASLDVETVAKPNVDITSPSGTITNTNVPTVTWSPILDAAGGPQTKYAVSLYNANTGVMWASTGDFFVAGSQTSWTPNVVLPNGNYTYNVQVAQTIDGVDHISTGDSSNFTINVARPAAPLIELTPDSDDGWVIIDILEQAGDATTQGLQVERSTDGGLTWQAIRTRRADGVVETNDIPVDWEAPIGRPVTYRARATHSYNGVLAFSAWAQATTQLDTTWWLSHPIDPELTLAVEIHAFPAVKRTARQGTHRPLGSDRVVVVSDRRGPITGTVTLRLDTDEQREQLDRMLDSLSPLLLRGRYGQGWRDAWIAVGDLDRTRLVDKAFVHETLDQLPFTVVDRPDGDIDEWPDVDLD